MAQADFAVITFDEHLGDVSYDITTNMPFMGNESSKKVFEVGAAPTGDGYLVLQTYDLQFDGHKFLLNDIDLQADGVHRLGRSPHNEWHTWMLRVTAGVLQQGQNTLQIKRGGISEDDSVNVDNFLVGDVVVHWRVGKG